MAAENALVKRADGEKLLVREATELAKAYNVPQSLINRMFRIMGDTVYPTVHFHLAQVEKKGFQSIVITEPKEVEAGVFETKCSIYPKVDRDVMLRLLTMPEEERKKYWDYLTMPTVEWGRASKETVRMSTLLPYLREMSKKRAVARACRIYAGGSLGTSAEEMPDANMSPDEVSDFSGVPAETKSEPQGTVTVICSKCNIPVESHPNTAMGVRLAGPMCSYNPDLEHRENVEGELIAKGITGSNLNNSFKKFWKKTDAEKTTVK